MTKDEVLEAAPIVEKALDAIVLWAPKQGRSGADLRTVIGNTRAHLNDFLTYDVIELALIQCFDLAYVNGIDLFHMEMIRRIVADQPVQSLGASMVKDTLIEVIFATAGYIISRTTYVSRDDVDRVKTQVNVAFEDMEVQIADQKDSMTWRAILHLHAAISMHLVETARPLPRMLNYRFNLTQPSLVMAHRLYADASRADELRAENKIVHPVFCPREGRALSA
jgi:prophage DNA circulation protein